MGSNQIIARCIKLGMSSVDAKWVAANLYTYACPDFSEWSWGQIDTCFRDALFFKDKTDAEVLATL